MRSTLKNRRKSERGFVLVITAVLAIVLIGALGLAADLGRAFVARNELMAFADAAAMAAAYKLDGTSDGITAANTAASSGPGSNKWKFGTSTISTVDVKFASSYNGTYYSAASAPVNSRFVRVTPSTPMPLFFLPVIDGINTSMNIRRSATAGQAIVTSPGPGLDPFSPDAVNPSDTESFGFVEGQQYDIKWAPPGQRNKPEGKCAGDIAAGVDAAGGSSDRGYIDVGQGGGNSDLYNGIVNNEFPDGPVDLTLGSTIDTVTGNMHVGPSLAARVAQDTDTTHNTYATYNGNGRRILKLAINDRTVPGNIIGYGAFLLPTSTYCMGHGGNNKACCAIYIGPAVLGGAGPGAGSGSNLYAVKLFD